MTDTKLYAVLLISLALAQSNTWPYQLTDRNAKCCAAIKQISCWLLLHSASMVNQCTYQSIFKMYL